MTLNQSLPNMISNFTTLIGIIVMMLIVNAKLAIIGLVSIPLSLIIMFVIVMFSQKYFRAQQANLGKNNGHIEEIYSGHTVVKVFNNSKVQRKKFEKHNGLLYDSAWKSQFYSDIMRPLMGFVGSISYIAVVVFGGIMALEGIILLGVVQTFLIYIRRFNQPIMQLAQTATILQSTAAASERVFEFLNEKNMEDESHKQATITNIKGDVEFRNVRFGYNEERTVINDFSIKVKQGQKVAIVGPTGAGKTTLVNLLMRFYDINSGDILIDGVSIYDMKREEVRKLFGMVLQDTWIFNGTIQENISYGNENNTLEEIIEACSNAHIDHFINSLPGGYQMVLDEKTGISEGQKQLLTIARAMVDNSPMLILDEATSNVDTRTELLIQNAMDHLTEGRTSFVIAHRLSTIKNADLILVLKDGDIIESGNHNELIDKKGFYSELYHSQFSGNDLQ
jgi:ATP-binding cassette subfamily B protein